jgi:hypothetical protein
MYGPEKDCLKEISRALCPFHNPDLFFCQPAKFVDQGVYLSICGFYLALEAGLLMGRAGLL